MSGTNARELGTTKPVPPPASMHRPALFTNGPCVVGMIHVAALPGTPNHALSLREIIAQAVAEATVYAETGADALMLENMHDRPYLKGAVGPEIVSTLTTIAHAVRVAVPGLPCGLQVLAAANHEALAIALAADLQFIRAEGFVFGHVADEGWIDGCAGELLRYRRQIGAEPIHILTDIKKKHSSHAVTADVSLVETARAAEYCVSDGVIVTGSHTGEAASAEDVRAVSEAVTLPVLVGSGITPENAHRYTCADAFIVGSWMKESGDWRQAVDCRRVEAMVAAAAVLRAK